MNRSLKLSMLLALALGSSQAAALELGQIHIRSALGQPLLAEIPVTLNSPAEGQSLSAQLASNVVFERANISNRPSMPLLFTVTGSGNHRLIRITSSAPINDPYLDLLIEVGSAAGRSTHEYTILLDPPGSVAQAAVPQASPTGTSSRVQPSSTDTGRAAPHHGNAASAAPVRHAVISSDGKYGPVEHGQTLSSIAHLAAPHGVDANQMMLALKQANPDAFFRDNINALKAGAVLRVPSAQDAQTLAAAAALAEVRRQNGDWRANGARTPVAVADAATRAGSTSSPTAEGAAADRLALVPAQSGAASAGGKGGKAVQQELQRDRETLTALQQQGDELKSRLKDLEDINSKNERLLSLKDSQIAELQSKLAAARKAAGLPAVAAAALTTPAAATSTAHAASPLQPSAAATTAVAATATTAPAKAASVASAAPSHTAVTPVASQPVPAAVPVSAKPAPVKPVPATSAGTPWYMQPWAWGVAAAALLLALLAALRGGRKPAAGPSPSVAPAPSLADRFSDEALPAHGSGDADLNELLDQLAEHPDDIGLHLELVSLYYGRRDVEHFEAAAEAMHAHVAHPQQAEWQDVLRMGRDLAPGHPLFAETLPPPMRPLAAPSVPEAHEGYEAHETHEAHESEALHPFDLDRYAGSEEDEVPPPSVSRPIAADHRYDFNLTQHASHAAPAHADTESAAPIDEPATNWRYDEPATVQHEHEDEPLGHGHFSDDPSDTKLDLARAYIDMGDPDGARAMLEEVLHEGSQMQRDVARRLLDELR